MDRQLRDVDREARADRHDVLDPGRRDDVLDRACVGDRRPAHELEDGACPPEKWSRRREPPISGSTTATKSPLAEGQPAWRAASLVSASRLTETRITLTACNPSSSLTRPTRAAYAFPRSGSLSPGTRDVTPPRSTGHIQELAAHGIPAPASVPELYVLTSDLLQVAPTVFTTGHMTSGEAEPVLIRTDTGALYVGIGSDHTDRQVEKTSILASKQACPKVLGRHVWPFHAVAEVWDDLELSSRAGASGSDYQRGTVERSVALTTCSRWSHAMSPSLRARSCCSWGRSRCSTASSSSPIASPRVFATHMRVVSSAVSIRSSARAPARRRARWR